MNIMLEPGAKMPTRAHPDDAGLDFYSRETVLVPTHGSAVFHTGVHVELPHGTTGILKSKSGLYVLYDITSDGVIDESYSGEIIVKLVNHGQNDYWVYEGDKISQLVIVPVYYEPVTVVDYLVERGRGNNGFGSTGR